MKNLGGLNDAAVVSSTAGRSKPAEERSAGLNAENSFCPPTDIEVFSLDIPFYRTAD
jgi:hypothetical protein